MVGNYNERKVGNDRINGIRVSTAMVTDGAKPFETAIVHPEYDNGEMIIIQSYLTLEDAKKGHSEWLKKAKNDKMPDPLIDCNNSGFGHCTFFRKNKL